jgi:Protein of unknown function (DUF2793)
MSESSPRFGLPFILPGQAQKELFHNEALLRVDAALSPVVEGGPTAEPPANPGEGQCWIVAVGGLGAWSGRDHSLAAWSEGGWRFVVPPPGMTAWNRADGVPMQWDGGAWSDGTLICSGLVVAGQRVVAERRPAVPSPSGGTIIDVEARAAINAVIATLMSHGLID